MPDATRVIQPFRLAAASEQPVGLAAGTLDGAVALPLVECLTLEHGRCFVCLLYTSPSPRDLSTSRMPSSA